MLTIPAMVKREPLRYVSVRLPVVILFAEEVDPVFDELFNAFARPGDASDGVEFVKFNLFDIPCLMIETGMTTDASIPLSGRLVEGVLPEGLKLARTMCFTMPLSCSSAGRGKKAWYGAHQIQRPESCSRAVSKST